MVMSLRKALSNYGIQMPEPEPQIDPREIDRIEKLNRQQEFEDTYRKALQRYMEED